MTHQPEKVEQTAGPSLGIEMPATRKVQLTLAFLAGWVGFGLGYVYVGRIRQDIAILVVTFGIWAFSAWTRLIVSGAISLWVLAAVLLPMTVTSLVHSIVIAMRHRDAPRQVYNRGVGLRNLGRWNVRVWRLTHGPSRGVPRV